jgi:eukaryotic translation initiation factor 2C
MASSEDNLPPPPPLSEDVVPIRAADAELAPPGPAKKKIVRVPLARRGLASKGQKIPLLTNHFKVNVTNVDGYFFHYSVALFYEDDRPVDSKGIGRKVLDLVQKTYSTDLDGKNFAYDGEKSLFTIGALPRNKLEFTVVLEEKTSSRNNGNASPNRDGSPNETDRKRVRRPYQSKTFKVEISFAAKIPMQAIAQALRGQESENSQEALRVLDIILRQHASKQGCLLVRQSFFHNDPTKFADVGGGVLGCRGYHSSFRTTQGGLSLNIDVSTTMIIQPGPVVDFLIANQNVKDPFSIDWAKAKRTLKNLRIKASPTNQEYKITGLSERPCKDQMFSLKQRKSNEDGEPETLEITVYDYFVNNRRIDLRYSADLPCINVGKPKRPTYIPIELCSLISLQRYTKALNTLQRSSLVEKSRQKPQERMKTLTDALKLNNYDAEPLLRASGVSINQGFTQVEGRVLTAPKLKLGNGEELMPRNGRWNLARFKFIEPVSIKDWAVVNFSARCDARAIVKDLVRCAESKGIQMTMPMDLCEESPQLRRAPPNVRVDQMFDQMQSKLSAPPTFILCLIPERKNCDIYGPWKKKNLCDMPKGIVSQCMHPTPRINDMYYGNLLLKINAKLGGINSYLSIERSSSIPYVSKVPTLILGMDVSHGSPGQSDIPSVAAVVSSRQWPSISRYRATVRTQSPKVEMIDNLFKPAEGGKDDGIIREALMDFYTSSGNRKPSNIIIFRDGVSESQFNQVLNIELEQITQACKYLDDKWEPKFVVIVAQKNHHTKFFQPNSPDNVPPGTVIDNKICHPRNYDFYMCAHAGMIGTTRPTHYHVLVDEIGFTADELQEFVHSLSYVYQRSTSAISVVAPICYAHLAAAKVGTFMKFEDMSESSSSQDGVTAPGAIVVPELPKMRANVRDSMFFV